MQNANSDPDRLNVLYCDDALLVCEKPAGCLSEPGAGANLPALAADWLRARGEDPELRTVHRLDKAVGGLMVLARTQAAAASLIDQIAARTVEKEYLAVLRGAPAQDEAVLEDLLFHDSRTNKTFVVTRPRKGVREAKLSYRVVGRAGMPEQPLTLVRVRLHTGRTHQIRAQFSHRGLPLLGDIRYGSKANHGPALFSCRLAFDHPTTGKRLEFERMPQGAPWDQFKP
ncbi:MAG: RluA family pseudouridine synthase [Oscillospiraceae bacterium]|nr:RluA family pseudouridine synthase [Oscillospiraceae bacterium]